MVSLSKCFGTKVGCWISGHSNCSCFLANISSWRMKVFLFNNIGQMFLFHLDNTFKWTCCFVKKTLCLKCLLDLLLEKDEFLKDEDFSRKEYWIDFFISLRKLILVHLLFWEKYFEFDIFCYYKDYHTSFPYKVFSFWRKISSWKMKIFPGMNIG